MRAALFGLAAFGAVLITMASLPYYEHPSLTSFWIEREPVSASLVWRGAFLVHVTGGIVCLFAALPQFSRRILRDAPRVHRVLGTVYVGSVLLLVVPPGLYLALYAGGGLPGRLGFLLNGILLFYTTWRGLERVRARNFRGHAAWMVRSWAMAATALTFRVLFILFDRFDVPGAYVAAIWSSVLINAAVAELFLLRRSAPRHLGASP